MTKDKIDGYSPIIFYDGDCGFCNQLVQFILKHRKTDFYFLSLQSKRAEELLLNYNVSIHLDTLYYLEDQKLYNQSTATLYISKHLKFPYPFFYFLGKIIPLKWRNKCYQFIAKRRKKILSSRCYLPSKEEREFFL